MKTKRFLSVLLVITISIISMISFTVSTSADTRGYIVPVHSGVENTLSLPLLGPDNCEVYSMKIVNTGDLTITIKSNLYKLCYSLVSAYGKIIKPNKIETFTGSVKEKGGNTLLVWDSSKKYYEGKITYTIKADYSPVEYYLRLYKSDYISSQTSDKITFKATFPSQITAFDVNITSLTLPMKVGETIQLDAILSKKTDKKVSWKSSKSSVAKVSSKGLVTAKSKGTATITASINKSKMQIQIQVK